MMYVHTVPIDNCNGRVPEPIQHIKFYGNSHRNVDFFFDGGKIFKLLLWEIWKIPKWKQARLTSVYIFKIDTI